ncbi:hypothetical protein FB451DRAFT_1221931 [Mycena latifolia]|nr:hypothetical protein FB451DRAFT_1221931 [Mycena latifolia]
MKFVFLLTCVSLALGASVLERESDAIKRELEAAAIDMMNEALVDSVNVGWSVEGNNVGWTVEGNNDHWTARAVDAMGPEPTVVA